MSLFVSGEMAEGGDDRAHVGTGIIRFLSTKNKPKLSYLGFRYNLDKHVRNTSYWRCENRQCYGRIVTVDDTIKGIPKPHLHAPDQAATEIQKLQADLKRKAVQSYEATGALINREVATVSEGIRGFIPREPTLKKLVRRERRRKAPPLPSTLDELDLGDDFCRTETGALFLLDDVSTENGRVILFCTLDNLRYLCSSKIWYGDGTFGIAPSLFYQVYTIHAPVTGQMLPLCYGLLTNKTQVLYTCMFETIKSKAEEHGIDLKVERFSSDMEQAAIQAAKDALPIEGSDLCFFHLAQAHWRKIQSLGLQGRYIEDPDFAIHLRMVTALAFLPPLIIPESFELLMDVMPEGSEEFTSYMALAPKTCTSLNVLFRSKE